MRLGIKIKETNNVFILGDSYSAFEGYIPAECVTWYSSEKKEVNIMLIY